MRTRTEPPRQWNASTFAVLALAALLSCGLGFVLGRAFREEPEKRPVMAPAILTPLVEPADLARLEAEIAALRADVRTVLAARAERAAIAPDVPGALNPAAPESTAGSGARPTPDLVARMRAPEEGLLARLEREHRTRPFRDSDDEGWGAWWNAWSNRTQAELTASHALWRAEDVVNSYGRPLRIEHGPMLFYAVDQTEKESITLVFEVHAGYVSGVWLDVESRQP